MMLARCIQRVFTPLRRFEARSSHGCSSYTYRTHTCGELRSGHVGETVTLCGWIKRPRLLGSKSIMFVPLTDSSGVTQLVCTSQDWQAQFDSYMPESVVKAVGVVRARPHENINKDIPTGAVEVELSEVQLLNEAQELAFSMEAKVTPASEELRMRERQLDLRRAAMQRNLRLRSQVAMTMREFLVHQHGFVEIETPTLFKRSPEGAREFVVPTGTPGWFYSLTQSPQQFKQLLMVGGFDRYFQFARCYRDEGVRPDRQPEFTQVDLEMSFVQAEGVMALTEDLVSSTLDKTVPHLKIPPRPFPRMPYKEAMSRYGSDKPDTRFGMELKDFSLPFHRFLQNDQKVVGFHIPKWEIAMSSLSRKRRSLVTEELLEIMSTLNVALISDNTKLLSKVGADLRQAVTGSVGEESCGELAGSVREHAGCSAEDACVVGGCHHDDTDTLLTVLGRLRSYVATVLQSTGLLELDPEQLNFMWVTDFPLFTPNQHPSQGVTSTHHPFTAPVAEYEPLLKEQWEQPKQLAKITGQHYDLVVNGVELGGGSIRIHSAELQEHVLKNVLKVPTSQFSHLLKGLVSGCPPHGGIALGFDRLMAVLCQSNSLRDVLAFPKSFKGYDLLAGAPSELSDSELASYHISVRGK